MIHVIDNYLSSGSRSLLQSMFANCKRLFVDLFGWEVQVADGQYEIYQFDNAETVYHVLAPSSGTGTLDRRSRSRKRAGGIQARRSGIGV